MKCQKFISGAILREKRKTCCPRMNSLAKYLALAVYTKIYCRVQRNRVLFIPVQCEKSGHTDHEGNRGGSAVPHDKAVALAACRQPGGCRRIRYIRVGEEKLHEENR